MLSWHFCHEVIKHNQNALRKKIASYDWSYYLTKLHHWYFSESATGCVRISLVFSQRKKNLCVEKYVCKIMAFATHVNAMKFESSRKDTLS